MNDDFSVRLRVEAMAAALEFQAQLGKIVDLAIEHDPGAAIFVEDRLVSTGQSMMLETPHAQTGPVRDVNPFVIGASVGDRVTHLSDESFADVALTMRTDHSGDPTHVLLRYPFTLARRRRYSRPRSIDGAPNISPARDSPTSTRQAAGPQR